MSYISRIVDWTTNPSDLIDTTTQAISEKSVTIPIKQTFGGTCDFGKKSCIDNFAKWR